MKLLTVPTQFSTPKQSPVPQALSGPVEVLVPSALQWQSVLPQTLPCQLLDTVSSLIMPDESSKPFVSGPLPFCVPIPGQMVWAQLLRMRSGVFPEEEEEEFEELDELDDVS